jgi:hypothetical protein
MFEVRIGSGDFEGSDSNLRHPFVWFVYFVVKSVCEC